MEKERWAQCKASYWQDPSIWECRFFSPWMLRYRTPHPTHLLTAWGTLAFSTPSTFFSPQWAQAPPRANTSNLIHHLNGRHSSFLLFHTCKPIAFLPPQYLLSFTNLGALLLAPHLLVSRDTPDPYTASQRPPQTSLQTAETVASFVDHVCHLCWPRPETADETRKLASGTEA